MTLGVQSVGRLVYHPVLLLVLCSSFVHLTLRTQLGATEGPLMPQSELRSDFDLLRKWLEEAHAGLYRYATKSEMDHVFELERAKLAHSMNKQDFLAVLAETLAQIRCGHTNVTADDDTLTAMSKSRKFPFRVRLEGKRLIVLLNDTKSDATIRPGMEVTKIDGKLASAIAKRLMQFEPADGDIVTGKRMHIGNFAKSYWLYLNRADQFTVAAKDGLGRQVVSVFSGVTDEERAHNQNPVNATVLSRLMNLDWVGDRNTALRFLEDPKIAEIRIRYFLGDDFPAWLETTFKSLKQKGTTDLILDLRGNGGGKDMFGALLVSYLTDKPFRYFDRIEIRTLSPTFREHSDWIPGFEETLRDGTSSNPEGGYLATTKLHPGLSEQSPSEHAFRGRVFVLIDGGTFSTAADVCAIIRHLRRATFIGEETGGAYYGNNSGAMPIVTLPNSKFRIRLPMYEYWNAVSGDPGIRRGTVPDYLVPTRAVHILLGHDDPLAMVRKLAATALE